MPFVPMLIIAFLIAGIFTAILKMCSQHEIIQDSHVPSVHEQTANHDLLIVDPFADAPAYEQKPNKVNITTKFVEVGSRSEELTFDWIVPFDQSTPEE